MRWIYSCSLKRLWSSFCVSVVCSSNLPNSRFSRSSLRLVSHSIYIFPFIFCLFYIFLKTFNMSSLIAKQVKTNMCFVSVSLFIVLSTVVRSHWTDTTIIACSQFSTHTAVHATWLRNTRLTELSLSITRFLLLFIYARLQSAERSQSKKFAFSPAWEFNNDRLYMCILIIVCPSCLLLLVYLEGVRCIC